MGKARRGLPGGGISLCRGRSEAVHRGGCATAHWAFCCTQWCGVSGVRMWLQRPVSVRLPLFSFHLARNIVGVQTTVILLLSLMVLGVLLGVFSCSFSQRVAGAGISRRLTHPCVWYLSWENSSSWASSALSLSLHPPPPLFLRMVPPAWWPGGS